MPENESTLRTARYTGGPEEDCAKNTGENGRGPLRTAQNTHIGRLKRGRGVLGDSVLPACRWISWRLRQRKADGRSDERVAAA